MPVKTRNEYKFKNKPFTEIVKKKKVRFDCDFKWGWQDKDINLETDSWNIKVNVSEFIEFLWLLYGFWGIKDWKYVIYDNPELSLKLNETLQTYLNQNN